MNPLNKNEWILRICERLALLPAQRIQELREALRARSDGLDLLALLAREKALDEDAARLVQSTLARLQSRLASVEGPPLDTDTAPRAIEIGGVKFQILLENDPYSDIPTYRLRSGSCDRLVHLARIPAEPEARGSFGERIRRLRAAGISGIARVYGCLDLDGVSHAVTACPDGAPLPIYMKRFHPSRAQMRLLAADLVRLVRTWLEAGIVHGDLEPDQVRVSGAGKIELIGFVGSSRGDARRDLVSTALLVHRSLRLEPEPRAFLETIATHPPKALLFDLLRVRNPSLTEHQVRSLVQAYDPDSEPVATLREIEAALLGKSELANGLTELGASDAKGSEVPPPQGAWSLRGMLRLFAVLGGVALFAGLLFGPGSFQDEHVGSPTTMTQRGPGDPPVARNAGSASWDAARGAPHRADSGSAPRGAPPRAEADSPGYLARVERIAEAGLDHTKAAPAAALLAGSFDEAVLAFPQEPRVYLDRGRMLAARTRHEEAIRDLDRAVALASSADDRPTDRQVLYDSLVLRALSLHELGRFENVLADLSKARDLLPKRHEAVYVLGRLLDRAGRHGSATALYREALAAGHPTYQGLYLTAVSEYYRGDIDTSERLLREATVRNESAPGPHVFLARILAERGRPDEARGEFARSLELDPRHYEGLFYFARFLHESGGERSKAGELYLAAVRVDPARPGAYNGLGLLEAQEGRQVAALTFFEKTLTLAPHHVPALLNRASILFHRESAGDLDTAIADLRQVVEIEPSSDEAYLLLGMALVRKGEPAKALDAFSWAIHHDRHSSRAYYNRGMLYLEHGNRDRARADFKQAADSDGAYDLPRLELGHLAHEDADGESARGWYEEATRANPMSPDAHNYLGAAVAVEGNLDLALASFDRAIELAPDHATALANRARCLARIGRLAEARLDYDRALELEPEDELAAERAEVLEALRQ